jgi:hypothetical protein
MEDKRKNGSRAGGSLRESPARLLRSIEKRVTELSDLGPEIIGSLCSRSGKCRTPGCACQRGTPMHISWQLTRTERGRTRTVYVPLAALEQVRAWAENHKRGSKLRKEVSDLCERYIRTVVPRERAISRRSASKGLSTEGEE